MQLNLAYKFSTIESHFSTFVSSWNSGVEYRHKNNEFCLVGDHNVVNLPTSKVPVKAINAHIHQLGCNLKLVIFLFQNLCELKIY